MKTLTIGERVERIVQHIRETSSMQDLANEEANQNCQHVQRPADSDDLARSLARDSDWDSHSDWGDYGND
jgi:hypothetical protein